mgnify:CR=1 FL=1
MSTPAATTPTSASTTENLVIWADGRLVAPGAVARSAVDHGVPVGGGGFGTCGGGAGRGWAGARHLRRLARSAAGLGLAAPAERRVLGGVGAVRAAAGARPRGGAGPVGRLRITVTAGVGPLGSGRTPGEQTVVVAVGPAVLRRSGRPLRSAWTGSVPSRRAGCVGRGGRALPASLHSRPRSRSAHADLSTERHAARRARASGWD